jgi:hypothetical protein
MHQDTCHASRKGFMPLHHVSASKAFLVQGFLTADSSKAQQFFDLATDQFDLALKQVGSPACVDF